MRPTPLFLILVALTALAFLPACSRVNPLKIGTQTKDATTFVPQVPTPMPEPDAQDCTSAPSAELVMAVPTNQVKVGAEVLWLVHIANPTCRLYRINHSRFGSRLFDVTQSGIGFSLTYDQAVAQTSERLSLAAHNATDGASGVDRPLTSLPFSVVTTAPPSTQAPAELTCTAIAVPSRIEVPAGGPLSQVSATLEIMTSAATYLHASQYVSAGLPEHTNSDPALPAKRHVINLEPAHGGANFLIFTVVDALVPTLSAKCPVSFDVVTKTAPATPPPAPTATLQAKVSGGNDSRGPLTVAYNGTVQLSWTSTNATACEISPNIGPVALAGNSLGSNALTSNRTFTLECTGPGGVATSSVSVTVMPAKQSCTIVYKTSNNHGCDIRHPEFIRVWVPAIPFHFGPAAEMDDLAEANDYRLTWAHYPSQCTTVTPPPSFQHQGNTYKVLDASGVPGGGDCEVFTYNYSPLLVDLKNEGIRLTSPVDGPTIDLSGDGVSSTYSWPSNPESSAFLSLDKNENGKIDGIAELFGNATVGPNGETAANGFEALAVYDGNADGFIDANDPVYFSLKLWQDRNLDGKTDAGELSTLLGKNVERLNLKFEAVQERQSVYGDAVLQKSSARLTNGSERRLVDLWLVRGINK